MASLSDKQEELCAKNPFDFSGLKAAFVNCTLKPSPEVSNTDGLMAMSAAIMRKERRRGDRYPARRPPDRLRRLSRHDRARLHGGRLAEDDLAGHPRGRHPGGRLADLARPDVGGRQAPDRAALRHVGHAQRQGPVDLLRQGRRLRDHRQRGRRQALRHGDPLCAAACRLCHPAAGRLRLDRRYRAGAVLSRRGLGRALRTSSPSATPPS